MHLQLAKHNGATSLVVVDLKDSRLDLARQLGATCVINPQREDPVATVKDLTEGRGADVVIETAGSPEVWQLSVELVRKGGTVVWFGGCPAGSEVSLDTGRLHYGELTVKGVFHHTPKTVTKALGLLSNGVIDAPALINQRAPLEDTQRALEMVMTGEAIKVAIFPE
jgi:L-iditol 2-dehydrogenase